MQGMRQLQNSLSLSSRQRQTGITTLGIIFLVMFVGVFAFAAIRLTPVYLNYMKIVGVIDGVVAEFEGQNANSAALRRSINRRFDVESVSQIDYRDVKVSGVYDHKTPFISNVSFMVHFDKTETVRR